MPRSEPFLVLAKYHLSDAKAKKAVDSALVEHGLELENIGPRISINLTVGKNKIRTSYAELVESTRLTGVVPYFREYQDSQDSIFGGTYELSIPNFQMGCKTEWAGWKKSWQGPGRNCPSERDLMRDILYFREQTCLYSNNHSFLFSCRYYRAYLLACISIVESFMNRYIHRANYDGYANPSFDALVNTTNFKKRVRLWLECFCSESSYQFFDSAEWSQFCELRRQRNELVHAVCPLAIYQIREIQRYLNFTQVGVGGLLRLIRKLRAESIPAFVQRLLSAPCVKYRRIRFRSGGENIIKEYI